MNFFTKKDIDALPAAINELAEAITGKKGDRMAIKSETCKIDLSELADRIIARKRAHPDLSFLKIIEAFGYPRNKLTTLRNKFPERFKQLKEELSEKMKVGHSM